MVFTFSMGLLPWLASICLLGLAISMLDGEGES